MFNISIYLDKFKNIEIKNGIIYLKVNPVLKNEIFINKNSIIRELNLKNLAIKGVF